MSIITKPLAKTRRYSAQERNDALTRLLGTLDTCAKDRNGKPKIYAIVSHVARSGMSRRFSFYAIDSDERADHYLAWLTYHIAAVLGDSLKNDALPVAGCGMDMGFHTLDSLAYVLSAHTDFPVKSGNDFALSYL